MKKQHISVPFKRFLIVTLIALITTGFTILLLATKSFPVVYSIIIFFLAFISSLYSLASLSALIVSICVNIYFKRRERKSRCEVNSILSHEFKEVTLKDITILQEVPVSCKAKIDETGEIIFEIKINSTAKGHTNDYTYFLEKFDIE